MEMAPKDKSRHISILNVIVNENIAEQLDQL